MLGFSPRARKRPLTKTFSVTLSLFLTVLLAFLVTPFAALAGNGEPAPDAQAAVAQATWYFAEGCTTPGFETWVLAMNPGDTAAHVNLSFYTENGVVAGPQNVTLAPHQRVTFDASRYVTSAHVSPVLTSDNPVVAERSCYWNGRDGGHNSIGESGGQTQWYFAEGCTAPGFETWILAMNPGNTAAQVSLNFYTENGEVAGPQKVTVEAKHRATFNAAQYVTSAHVSPVLTSDQPVVAERSCYWNERDDGSNSGGYSTLGVKEEGVRTNHKPLAEAGSAQIVQEQGKVRLDGTGSSDADGDRLAYKWEMLAKPAGSNAALGKADSDKPSFTADKTGEYLVQLIVSDGALQSDPDTVTVTCVPPLSNPITPDGFQIKATYGQSWLAENTDGKELLYLEGNAYERGLAEGTLCADSVYRITHDFVDKIIFEEFGVPADGSQMPGVWPALKSVIVQAAMSQNYAVPEEFQQEMAGIAQGASNQGYAVSYEDVLTPNIGFDLLLSTTIYQGGSLACNAFSVFGEGTTDGRLYHGRDFMFATGGDVFSDEACMIVQKPTEGNTFVTTMAPGFVGFATGLSEQGVSCNMDMVPNRQNRPLISGMGCLLICRNVVEHANSLPEGIASVKETSRGCSWLYMIADGKIPDAAVLETVADSQVPTGPDFISTISSLVPGWQAGMENIPEPIAGEVIDGSGQVITGASEAVDGGMAIAPFLGDVHPDQGVAVRTSDYVDPQGLEQYRIGIPMQDPLVPSAKTTDISPFPLQQEDKPDMVAVTNHYILPPMNLTQMGLFYHTVDTYSGGGRESEWRYNTMMDLLLKNYGNIEARTGMWLIDFLNPARCDYYGTDMAQSVKGHHVLMDNQSLEMWSLHGYYNQPWEHVDLKWFLGGSSPIQPGNPPEPEPQPDIPAGHLLRDDLGVEPSQVGATGATTKLVDIFQVSDVHICDEDNPLRVEALDPVGPPLTGCDRPQEHLSVQALDSMVQTINELNDGSEPGSFQEGPFDAVIATGDNVDNCQGNETRWFIDALDGKTVDPSSAQNPGLAFDAAGLDSTIPWYSVIGNHDGLIQGNVPPNLVGLVGGLIPLLNGAQTVNLSQYISEYFQTTTQPAGHGFGLSGNVNDGYYAFDPKPGVRFLVLNTLNDDWADMLTGPLGQLLPQLSTLVDLVNNLTQQTLGGYAEGYLDVEQLQWMKDELAASRDKLVVVFAHHPTGSFVNPQQGAEVEATLEGYPNVIGYIAGHTHQNRVAPQKTGENGYWKVETASLIDLPSEGRDIQIIDNGDGTGSLVLTCEQVTDGQFLALAASDPQTDSAAAGTEADRDVALEFAIPPLPAQTIRDAYGTPGPPQPPAGSGLDNYISADDFTQSASYGNSYLASNSAGKQLLYLEGNAYDRGYAEGQLAPEAVYRMTHDFVDNIIFDVVSGEMGVPVSKDQVEAVWPAVRTLLVQAAAANRDAVPQEFQDEMRGMADACQAQGYDVTFEEILTLNCGFDVLESIYQNIAAVFMCNEFGVFNDATADGRLYHGRDFMFPTGGDVFSDEALMIVQKPTDGYAFVASAAPGMVGIPTGLNTEGVSCGMDVVYSVFSRPAVTGMGCLLLCRQVVQYASSMDEGVASIKDADRGVPWLYMIGDGQAPNACVLETEASTLVPPGDAFLADLCNLIPGLDTALAGLQKLLPTGIIDLVTQQVMGGANLLDLLVELLPRLAGMRPDNGAMVRSADWVDPPDIDLAGFYYLPDPLKAPIVSRFPKQQETHPDLVAMTNHYIIPQMAASEPGLADNNTDSQGRYDTMLPLLEQAYGSIDRIGAMWLIDFLNPARCDYYGTDRTQAVQGHHVLMDNYTLEMWSLHGYYDQPWEHVNLREVLELGPPGPPNQPPVAEAGPDVSARVNETVAFDGTGSSDSVGAIASYDWDFGDGNTASGAQVSHTYAAEGSYTVTLTARDDQGASAQDSCQAAISAAELAELDPWVDEPPANQYLAGGAWASSHRNPYCQASSPLVAPISADGLQLEHQTVVADIPITLTFSNKYPGGEQVIWGSTVGFTGQVFKMDCATFNYIDCYVPQVEEGAPLQTGTITGAYNALDNEGTFFVCTQSGIDAFCDETAGDPSSPIQLKARYVIPDGELCRPGEERVVGLTMTYDGMVAFATNLGTVGVIARDLNPASARFLRLNNGVDPSVLTEDLEQISNSIAADENGGIYVVTDARMYRVQWTGTVLTLDPMSGAWRAPYDVGASQQGGRLGEGSGTTPTLMGTGSQDKFVVITDGAQLMNLVLFWRDEIPAGWQPIAPGKDPRIAAEVPINFGDPSATESYTDQSVLVRGYGAVVVNNRLGSNVFDLLPAEQQPYSMLASNLPGIAPSGIQKFVWDPDTRRAESAWANPDVSIPNAIPTMSADTGLIYGVGARNGCWTLEAVDWNTGDSRFCRETDPLPFNNSFYAATEVGPDGCIYTGTFGGVSRFRPADAQLSVPIVQPPADTAAMITDKNVLVTMADGTKLATDVFRPAADAKYPAILSMTPYNKDVIELAMPYPSQFVPEGYVVVYTDIRGTGNSQGQWTSFGDIEGRDGYELVEWIAAQPWCDGNVGMLGASYMGIIQLFTAGHQPPHLKCIFPIVAMSDAYSDIVFQGGTLDEEFIPSWLGLVVALGLAPPTYAIQDPLAAITAITQHIAQVPIYGTWLLNNYTYNSFYDERSPARLWDQINVPMYCTAGWFDLFTRGAFRNFTNIDVPKKMMAGEWYHLTGALMDGVGGPAIQKAWFDYWLKGIDNGIMDEPDINLYVMGADRWRTENEWPLARAVNTDYYLSGTHPGSGVPNDWGLTTQAPPAEATPESMNFDPTNGVLSRSTTRWAMGATSFLPTAENDQLNELKCLCYSTDVLTQDLEVTGPITMTLYASSAFLPVDANQLLQQLKDASGLDLTGNIAAESLKNDVQWVVNLQDVGPDGSSRNITSGWLLASHRVSDVDPVSPEAGVIYEYTIEIWPTSNVFQAGHRIRLDLSNSDFPHLLPVLVPSISQIYHDAAHPSHVTLPVIPAGSTDPAQWLEKPPGT